MMELPPQLQWALGPFGALVIMSVVAWLGFKGHIWSKRQVDQASNAQREAFKLAAKEIGEAMAKGMEAAMTNAIANGVPTMYKKIRKFENGKTVAALAKPRRRA